MAMCENIYHLLLLTCNTFLLSHLFPFFLFIFMGFPQYSSFMDSLFIFVCAIFYEH